MGHQRSHQTKTAEATHHKTAAAPVQQMLPTRTPLHPLLQLQRLIGNRAVSQLIQAKLKVSQPGDVFEQEADRIADAVMRMPDPRMLKNAAISRHPQQSPIQRVCTECEKELHHQPTDDDDEKMLHDKEAPRFTPVVTPDLEAHINSMQGGGQPLPESVRAFFEPRFGSDFGQVHIHADVKAAESARLVDALAYTVKRDIVFGAGQYRPQTQAGKWLLAHELTHVMQQNNQAATLNASIPTDPVDASWERESDAVANGIVSNSSIYPSDARRGAGVSGEIIFPYRQKNKKKSPRFNEFKAPETSLVEEEFTDSETQPWIEQINLNFSSMKKLPDGNLIATGTLDAIYKNNKAPKQIPIQGIPISGGGTLTGLTDEGSFKVWRIEGFGYNNQDPSKLPGTGGPLGKTWPANRYSKGIPGEILRANMHFSIFFQEGQAIHSGQLNEASLACVHIDQGPIMQQLNYHSVIGYTTVKLTYASGIRKALCCSQIKRSGVTAPEKLSKLCRNEDSKTCP